MAEANSSNKLKLVAGALGTLLLLSTVLINSLNSDISDNESLIKSQEAEIKAGKDQIVQLGVDHSTEITALQENHTIAITEIEEDYTNIINQRYVNLTIIFLSSNLFRVSFSNSQGKNALLIDSCTKETTVAN